MRNCIIYFFIFLSLDLTASCGPENNFDPYNGHSGYLNADLRSARMTSQEYRDCLEKQHNYNVDNFETLVELRKDGRRQFEYFNTAVSYLPIVGKVSRAVNVLFKGYSSYDIAISQGFKNKVDFFKLNLDIHMTNPGKFTPHYGEEIFNHLNEFEQYIDKYLHTGSLTSKEKEILLDFRNTLNGAKSNIVIGVIQASINNKKDISRSEIREIIKKTVKESDTTINKWFEEKFKKIESGIKLYSKLVNEARIDQQEYEDFIARLDDYEIFSNATAGLYSFFDSQAAANLQNMSSAAFQFLRAFSKLERIQKGAAGSALGPYGMMAMTAFSLMGSSRNNSQSMMEAIMKAFEDLSGKIDDLNINMQRSFQGIQDQLSIIEFRIMKKFGQVLNKLSDINSAINELNKEIVELRNSFYLSEIEEIDSHKRSHIKAFISESHHCLNGKLKRKEYQKCVRFYENFLLELKNLNNDYYIGRYKPSIQNKYLSVDFNTHIYNFITGLDNYFDIKIDLPIHPNILSIYNNDVELFYIKQVNTRWRKKHISSLKKSLKEIQHNQRSFYNSLKALNKNDIKKRYDEELKRYKEDTNRNIENYLNTNQDNIASRIYYDEIRNQFNDNSLKAIKEKCKEEQNNLREIKNILFSNIKRTKYKREFTEICNTLEENAKVASEYQGSNLAEFNELSKKDYFWLKSCNETEAFPNIAFKLNELNIDNTLKKLLILDTPKVSICYNPKIKKNFKSYVYKNGTFWYGGQTNNFFSHTFTGQVQLDPDNHYYYKTKREGIGTAIVEVSYTGTALDAIDLSLKLILTKDSQSYTININKSEEYTKRSNGPLNACYLINNDSRNIIAPFDIYEPYGEAIPGKPRAGMSGFFDNRLGRRCPPLKSTLNSLFEKVNKDYNEFLTTNSALVETSFNTIVEGKRRDTKKKVLKLFPENNTLDQLAFINKSLNYFILDENSSIESTYTSESFKTVEDIKSEAILILDQQGRLTE